jgi:hypothetical protein
VKLSNLGIACAVVSLAAGPAVPAAAAGLSAGYQLGGVNFTCGASGQGSGSLTHDAPGCAEYLLAGTFLWSGSAQASYDTLRATARVGVAGLRKNSSTGIGATLGDATASARYDDTLTIDVAGRTGDVVDLVFTTALSGGLSAVADLNEVFASAGAGLVTFVKGVRVGISQSVDNSSGVPVGSDFNPGLVQITLGQPFSVSAQLTASATLLANVRNGLSYSGEAAATFSNSGGITSFQLFEAGGGAPITDWMLTSESGEFGFYTAVVPVPAGGWLFGSALAALVAVRRSRRSARGG